MIAMKPILASKLRRIGVCTLAAAIMPALMGGCGKPRAGFDEVYAEAVREYDAQNYAEALGMFKHAAEIDRERPEPSYFYGLCYMGMADAHFKNDNLPAALRCCDQAVSAFAAAIGAFPGYTRAVQGKADALRLKGKHQAALDIARWAATQSGPQASMLILKGRDLAQSGDIDGAQLSFRQATSVEPENAAAHAELGLFFMRCGNDREAIASLRKAYELDPGAPGVVAALARLGAMTDAPAGK
ncbi:MAG: hypothetical protein AMXMBFR20_23810 [Planctomycetia bacterium]|nr:tetratricopeptide repeat protein [Planctomycetota bacterium]OQZ07111.1 MAG: hypothetical protein B6D36_01565 [Planctomycetes bacterium UTPLA1]